jgi:hypothetical protein
MEEQLFGKLFNTVPLVDENHLETILNTMDKNSATYLLVQAVKHAYHSGVYSLGESEVISKCIRTISNEEKKVSE